MNDISLTRDQKLKEVQDKAEGLNRRLHQEFHEDRIYKTQVNGGNLFAGADYAADSRILYVSLNPAVWPGRASFDVSRWGRCWYWGITGATVEERSELRANPYWRNSNECFNSRPKLKYWLEDSQSTCTFAKPWRTPKAKSLNGNPALRDTVDSYSMEIMQLMFKHCRPELVIASGKGTLEFLARCFDVVVPWVGRSELAKIGQPGCQANGWVMIARQDLPLSNGNVCSYAIWKRPRGRKYLLCQNETDHKGKEVLETDNLHRANQALGQLASGTMKQEFYDEGNDPRHRYQWGSFRSPVNSDIVDLFLVPHFSAASDRRLLSECAKWLEDKLLNLGYMKGG